MNENKLQQAIDAIHAGKTQTAQVLLAQILKDDINQDSAWVWMASLQDDPVRKMQCLERALKANPDNARAKQMVADLASGTIEEPEEVEPSPPGEFYSAHTAAESSSLQPFDQAQDQILTPFQPIQTTEEAALEPVAGFPAAETPLPAVEETAKVTAASTPLKARPARRVLTAEGKPVQPAQAGFDADAYRSLAQPKGKSALSGMKRSQVIALAVLGLLTLIMIIAVVAVLAMTFKIF